MDDLDRPTRTPWIWPAAIAALVLLLALAALLPGLGTWGLVVLCVIAVLALVLVSAAFVSARRQRRVFESRIARWAAERAVAEERLRIARDLHDLASHGLGLMTVRAATANLADDAERRLALTDIEKLGREATGELRRMLTILRGTGEDRPAPLSPTMGLADLPAVVDGARRAGLGVEHCAQDLGDVPRGVQLTVCSVVREGLANALRHAGPTSVRLDLRRDGDEIVVDLRDAGPVAGWAPHPGAGHGLTGLRERIALHGGSLTTGPTDHGFRVLAAIPLEER